MNSVISSAIRTWKCENCIYSQDTDPTSIFQQHPSMFPNVPLGKCPACYSKGLESNFGVPLDQSEMSIVNVATDETLASTTVQETDEYDQPVMIQTGERYELRVNQQTGEIYSEAVPVYEPKMRELTSQELAQLMQQRDDSLRTLEDIAV